MTTTTTTEEKEKQAVAVSEIVSHPPMEDETPKAAQKRSVLGSLREAITKVRFLLSSSATRWMLLRSLASRGAPARRLSFDSRPGLLDVEDSLLSPASSSSSSRITSRSASLGTATTRSLSRTSSAASPEALKRASSASSGGGGGSPAAAGDDDIDQRAELFIENFYRQLRMERQVSLQLRYVRGNSWDRTPAASPSPSRG